MIDFLIFNKIIVVFINILGISLSFLVYFSDRRRKINQLFFLTIIFLVFWINLDFFSHFSQFLISGTYFLPMPANPLRVLAFVTFLLFCVFGYLLIKSTLKEFKEKEILEEKVKERTKELQETKEKLEEAKNILEIRVKARTRELEEVNQGLEEKVKERTKELQKQVEELEKWYRLTVGRELKMIELKEKLKELEEKVEKKEEM